MVQLALPCYLGDGMMLEMPAVGRDAVCGLWQTPAGELQGKPWVLEAEPCLLQQSCIQDSAPGVLLDPGKVETLACFHQMTILPELAIII